MTKVLGMNTAFDQATIGHAFIDSRTGCFIQVNEKFCEIIGRGEKTVTDMTFMDIVHPGDLHEKMYHIQELLEGGIQEITVEKCFTREDGSIVWLNLSLSALWDGCEPYRHLVILEDITDRKRSEDELQKTNKRLDRRVAERTAALQAANEALKKHEHELREKNKSLEELNTTLKVLIHKQDGARQETGEAILSTIKAAIEPSLDTLSQLCTDDRPQKCISTIKMHLQNLVAPFTLKLKDAHADLSRTEIKVADLIKHGFSNKKIADHMHVSVETVAFHRKNIRRKLGLTNSKENLVVYLQHIEKR